MKVKTYLDLFMDVIGMGPLISECISPKMHDAWLAFPRSNMLRVLSNNTTLANSGGSFDDWEAFKNGIIL